MGFHTQNFEFYLFRITISQLAFPVSSSPGFAKGNTGLSVSNPSATAWRYIELGVRYALFLNARGPATFLFPSFLLSSCAHFAFSFSHWKELNFFDVLRSAAGMKINQIKASRIFLSTWYSKGQRNIQRER